MGELSISDVNCVLKGAWPTRKCTSMSKPPLACQKENFPFCRKRSTAYKNLFTSHTKVQKRDITSKMRVTFNSLAKLTVWSGQCYFTTSNVMLPQVLFDIYWASFKQPIALKLAIFHAFVKQKKFHNGTPSRNKLVWWCLMTMNWFYHQWQQLCWVLETSTFWRQLIRSNWLSATKGIDSWHWAMQTVLLLLASNDTHGLSSKAFFWGWKGKTFNQKITWL